MKRFLIQTSVLKAEGSQTWYVDADTEAEALQRYNDGDGDIYASEVDVTSLGEPELAGETTLDDFGDADTTPPLPVQRTWVGLTEEEIDKTPPMHSNGGYEAYARAIEAKLKEKNT